MVRRARHTTEKDQDDETSRCSGPAREVEDSRSEMRSDKTPVEDERRTFCETKTRLEGTGRLLRVYVVSCWPLSSTKRGMVRGKHDRGLFPLLIESRRVGADDSRNGRLNNDSADENLWSSSQELETGVGCSTRTLRAA